MNSIKSSSNAFLFRSSISFDSAEFKVRFQNKLFIIGNDQFRNIWLLITKIFDGHKWVSRGSFQSNCRLMQVLSQNVIFEWVVWEILVSKTLFGRWDRFLVSPLWLCKTYAIVYMCCKLIKQAEGISVTFFWTPKGPRNGFLQLYSIEHCHVI